MLQSAEVFDLQEDDFDRPTQKGRKAGKKRKAAEGGGGGSGRNRCACRDMLLAHRQGQHDETTHHHTMWALLQLPERALHWQAVHRPAPLLNPYAKLALPTALPAAQAANTPIRPVHTLKPPE
jgi:hypothetical protein